MEGYEGIYVNFKASHFCIIIPMRMFNKVTVISYQGSVK